MEDTETVTFPPLACDGTSDTLYYLFFCPPSPHHASSRPPRPPSHRLLSCSSSRPPLVGPSREVPGPPIDLHCDSPGCARPAVNLPIKSQEQVDNTATPSSFPGYLSGDTLHSQGRVRADRPHRSFRSKPLQICLMRN